MKSPIFIFSLPRSGSTLLQRILMSHSEIASVAEPWLLLPFVYSSKKEGVLSEYSHFVCHQAIEDLINNLPNKKKDYNRFLGEFANNIYSSFCNNGEIYFLDKTPRYYLIIPEIANIFPDAKFVFLFRNPVHVYSSIVTSWGGNRLFNLYNNYMDLFEGPKLLSQGYDLLKTKSYAIQYEKLLENPEKHLRELLTYLNLDYDESLLTAFSNQDTKGRWGDTIGVKEYKKIEKMSLSKWEKTFSSFWRKKLIKSYVNKLGESTLSLQGYSRKIILKDIQRLSGSKGKPIRDSLDYIFSLLVISLNANLYFVKETKKWVRRKFIS